MNSETNERSRQNLKKALALIPPLLFTIAGACSAIAQALFFSNTQTTFWPLLVLWCSTAIIFLIGGIMMRRRNTATGEVCILSIAAVAGISLIGSILFSTLGISATLSGLEYAALGSYIFFLLVFIIIYS